MEMRRILRPGGIRLDHSALGAHAGGYDRRLAIMATRYEPS